MNQETKLRSRPAAILLTQAAQQRIRIRYAADSGRWIGLDAETKGDRQLSYRLTSPTGAP